MAAFSVEELQALHGRLNVSSAFYTQGSQVMEQEGDAAPGSSGIQGTGSMLWLLAASNTERASSQALRMLWGLFGKRSFLAGSKVSALVKSSWELLVDTGGLWGHGGGVGFQGTAMH